MTRCLNSAAQDCLYALDHTFRQCSFDPQGCPFIAPAGGGNGAEVKDSLAVDPRTGLATVPRLPCALGSGLCRLRLYPGGRFECAFKPESCRFLVKASPSPVPRLI